MTDFAGRFDAPKGFGVYFVNIPGLFAFYVSRYFVMARVASLPAAGKMFGSLPE